MHRGLLCDVANNAADKASPKSAAYMVMINITIVDNEKLSDYACNANILMLVCGFLCIVWHA